MWIPPKQTSTYKDWRTRYNPWNEGEYTNFKGNLDPVKDANLIEGIHSLIDAYCDPRHIGVSDEGRFNVLFHVKLQELENRFFNMLKLENVYYNNDELKYTSIEQGRNTSKTTGEASSDSTTTGTNNTEVTGENIVDSDSRTNNSDNNTSTSNNRNRNLYSDTPQGNINAGNWLDGSYNWKYATTFDETKNDATNTSNNTSNGTSNTMTTSNNTSKTTGDTNNHNLTTTTNNDNNESEHEVKRIDDLGNRSAQIKNYLLSQYSAWEWLLNQLEVMFICTYEDGDY